MTNLLLIVGSWSGENCSNCAFKVEIDFNSYRWDDEELIAHDSYVSCQGVYFGQGLWKQPKI